MKVNDVFESTPKSVHDVISESGTCFHIPEYQRPYSWNEDKVIRLIDDIKAGCSVLSTHDDAITFLGTLLTVDDYKGDSLSPELKEEKPPKTRLVIDGQQRLTTLTLIATRLCLKLNSYLSGISCLMEKYQDKVTESELSNVSILSDSIYSLASELKYFSKDLNSRDKYNRYYPILTRSGEDFWSKQKNKAKYNSAIASYVYEVNKLYVDNEFETFPTADDETVLRNLKEIDKSLSRISDGFIFNDNDVVDLEDIGYRNFEQETYFKIGSVNDLISSGLLEDSDCIKLKESIYLSIFSSYFLYRTCFTFVSVNNLEYAFDMFEALNTTGEPLTAYETFRPKAIQFFHDLQANSEYEDERIGRGYLSLIDEYLNSISDAVKKNDQTKRLIDTFSYALEGKMCGTHISQQRRFLIDSFSSSIDKLEYLKRLAYTAEFLFSIWYSFDDDVISKCESSSDNKKELRLAISLLRSTGNEIVRPALSIAYYNFKSSNDFFSFKKCSKMFAAYWSLRRTGTQTTSGIDARYKELYSGAALGEKVIFGFDVNTRLAEISNFLKQDMKKTFSRDAGSFEEVKKAWVNRSKINKIYTSGKQLGICRMILLSSMDDFIADPDCKWKTVKAKKGASSTLDYYKWLDFEGNRSSQYTIEHIAPQSLKKYDWDSSLGDGELINTIGNLVVLARGDNSEASNKSWIEKKRLYKELASKKYNSDKNYNQFISGVANAPAWRADIILERGADLLSNSWDNLIKWMDM